MPYTVINTDATNMAQRTIDRIHTVDATAVISDPAKAIADSYLDCLGYSTARAQSDNAATAWTSASAAYVDVTGYATYAFTAPVAKTYLVCVDLSMQLTGSAGIIQFQLVPGALTSVALKSMQLAANELASHKRLSFRVPVAFNTSAQTLKLQAKTTAGTMTLDTNDFICWTVLG